MNKISPFFLFIPFFHSNFFVKTTFRPDWYIICDMNEPVSYIVRVFQFVRYKAEADEMWEHASDEVRQTYGREYLDAQIENQRNAITSSANNTKPVIDALVDGLISDKPQTRYLVDGGNSFIDRPAVRP